LDEKKKGRSTVGGLFSIPFQLHAGRHCALGNQTFQTTHIL
jgi:hypothetical protein